MPTLEDFFAGRNLSRGVQEIKSGLPLRVPAQFMTPTPGDRVFGTTAQYYVTDANRQMATVVSQASPAKRVGMQGVGVRHVKMLRTFESQQFDAEKLRNLLSEDQQRQQMGRQELQRQMLFFKQRQVNLIQASVQSMLLRQSLHFNSSGEMLTSSSGAAVSIDPGIPAGQKGQLDILGSGVIIDNSWATATTDIIGQIAEIKRQVLAYSGWELKHAFYGKNIAKYIAANNGAKEYINNTPALATQRYEGGNTIPTGFQNLAWHDASDAAYVDAAGSVQYFLGVDEIVFTPEPSPEWWRHWHGSEIIPSGVARAGTSLDEVVSQLTEVIGAFGYAEMTTNPVSVEHFSGLNWLPAIVATKAIFKADVTP